MLGLLTSALKTVWVANHIYCSMMTFEGHPQINWDNCHADNGDWVWASDGVQRPPPQYNHKPSEYYHTIIVSRKEMDTDCGEDDDACTYGPTKDAPFCISFLQATYNDGSDPKHIAEHEQAHCNGWHHKPARVNGIDN